MKLIGKKILVKQVRTKDKSEGGITLPSSMSEVLPYGTVKAVGPEVEEVGLGDVVLFTAVAAIPLGLKPDHVLIEPEDVLALLEEGEY